MSSGELDYSMFQLQYSYYDFTTKRKENKWLFDPQADLVYFLNSEWSNKKIPLTLYIYDHNHSSIEFSGVLKLDQKKGEVKPVQIKLNKFLAYLLGFTKKISKSGQFLRFDQNRIYISPHKIQFENRNTNFLHSKIFGDLDNSKELQKVGEDDMQPKILDFTPRVNNNEECSTLLEKTSSLIDFLDNFNSNIKIFGEQIINLEEIHQNVSTKFLNTCKDIKSNMDYLVKKGFKVNVDSLRDLISDIFKNHIGFKSDEIILEVNKSYDKIDEKMTQLLTKSLETKNENIFDDNLKDLILLNIQHIEKFIEQNSSMKSMDSQNDDNDDCDDDKSLKDLLKINIENFERFINQISNKSLESENYNDVQEFNNANKTRFKDFESDNCVETLRDLLQNNIENIQRFISYMGDINQSSINKTEENYNNNIIYEVVFTEINPFAEEKYADVYFKSSKDLTTNKIRIHHNDIRNIIEKIKIDVTYFITKKKLKNIEHDFVIKNLFIEK